MLRGYSCAVARAPLSMWHPFSAASQMVKSHYTPSGAIAQLGERIVRNDEVVGSIPTSSTILTLLFSDTHSAPFQFVPFLYRRLTERAFSLTFAPAVIGVFV
jgi:hypothetical protein